MTKTHSHSWTPEKLALKSRKEVETIRQNAVRLAADDLIAMCDTDLMSRAPRQATTKRWPGVRHLGSDVVTGYHFVCARDRGVSPAEKDHFWSGSWVVAEVNVHNSLKYGAYLALHESKSEPSYRQGEIVDYRRSARDMLPEGSSGNEVKTEEGIEFLVKETAGPFAWVGGGAGEKGYKWTKVAGTQISDPDNPAAAPVNRQV